MSNSYGALWSQWSCIKSTTNKTISMATYCWILTNLLFLFHHHALPLKNSDLREITKQIQQLRREVHSSFVRGVSHSSNQALWLTFYFEAVSSLNFIILLLKFWLCHETLNKIGSIVSENIRNGSFKKYFGMLRTIYTHFSKNVISFGMKKRKG